MIFLRLDNHQSLLPLVLMDTRINWEGQWWCLVALMECHAFRRPDSGCVFALFYCISRTIPQDRSRISDDIDRLFLFTVIERLKSTYLNKLLLFSTTDAFPMSISFLALKRMIVFFKCWVPVTFPRTINSNLNQQLQALCLNKCFYFRKWFNLNA